MGKSEDIFLGTCMHIAKEDLIARRVSIEKHIKELFEVAEAIYKEGHRRGFLQLPSILEREK